MDIVSRARNIIVRPAAEWPVIDTEPSSAGTLYTTYMIPLGLIGPIATFIGLTFIGITLPFIGTYRVPMVNGLTSAVISFVASLIGVYVWALIIDALAPSFLGQKNMLAALKVAIYTATPALLAGILSLIPALGPLRILAALYALYLLYIGLPILMKAPKEKALGYTVVTVLCAIVVGFVFAIVMGALRFSPLGAMMPSAFGPMSDHAASQAAAQKIASSVLGAAGGGTTDSQKAAETIVAGAIAAGKQAEAIDKAHGANSSNAADSTSGKDPADAKSEAAAVAAGAAVVGSMISGGKEKVEPVHFNALKALLPTEVAGLKRTHASGEATKAAGIATSMAEATYTEANGGQIDLKITDMANASGIMALGKMALSTESESDSGFEKNVVLNGQKVHEKWTNAGKSSELTALVGERFIVEVKGTGLDLSMAEKALEATDLGKLAAMKG